MGEEFQVELMHVLYPVLEKLGDRNTMINLNAMLTLQDISAACNYQ